MFGHVPAATHTVRAGTSTSRRSPVRARRRLRLASRTASPARAPYSSATASSGFMPSTKPMPFFEGFDDLLVVQAIRGRVLDTPCGRRARRRPSDRSAAESPALRRAPRLAAFLADRAAVPEELVEDLALFLVETAAQLRFIATGARSARSASSSLLDLDRVVGDELGRGVDGGQDRRRSRPPAGGPADWRATHL